MRVLLTGHRGFLGGVLDKLLRDRGHTVVGVDAGWFDFPISTNSKLVQSLTTQDLEGIEAIIHLAWFSSAGNDFANLQGYSLEATHHLAKICPNSVRHFIFASTASVYGFSDSDESLSEASPTRPVCAYGRAKLDAENFLRNHFENSTTKLTIFRMGTLMGCGVTRTRLDLCVNAFFHSALTVGRLKVWDSETHRPMLHVRDAAEAYVRALESGLKLEITYNLGHKNYQMLSLAHWVADKVKLLYLDPPKIEVDVDYTRHDSTRSYRINWSRAEEEGWRSGLGIRAVVDDFSKITDPSGTDLEVCYNIRWMRHLLSMKRFLSSISL